MSDTGQIGCECGSDSASCVALQAEPINHQTSEDLAAVVGAKVVEGDVAVDAVVAADTAEVVGSAESPLPPHAPSARPAASNPRRARPPIEPPSWFPTAASLPSP